MSVVGVAVYTCVHVYVAMHVGSYMDTLLNYKAIKHLESQHSYKQASYSHTDPLP